MATMVGRSQGISYSSVSSGATEAHPVAMGEQWWNRVTKVCGSEGAELRSHVT